MACPACRLRCGPCDHGQTQIFDLDVVYSFIIESRDIQLSVVFSYVTIRTRLVLKLYCFIAILLLLYCYSSYSIFAHTQNHMHPQRLSLMSSNSLSPHIIFYYLVILESIHPRTHAHTHTDTHAHTQTQTQLGL